MFSYSECSRSRSLRSQSPQTYPLQIKEASFDPDRPSSSGSGGCTDTCCAASTSTAFERSSFRPSSRHWPDRRTAGRAAGRFQRAYNRNGAGRYQGATPYRARRGNVDYSPVRGLQYFGDGLCAMVFRDVFDPTSDHRHDRNGWDAWASGSFYAEPWRSSHSA